MKRLWYFLFLSLVFGAYGTERQLRKASIQSERGTVVKTERIDNQIELRITDNTKLNPSFQIIRLDNHQILWETPVSEKRSEAFLQLGSGEQYRPPISNGNYQVNFTLTTLTNGMKIDSVEKHEARFFQATDELNENVLIKGSLLQCSEISSNKECEKKSDFTLTFNFIGKRLSSGYNEKELKKNLNSMTISFSVSVTPVSSLEINEIHTLLTLSSNDKESFHGFGESFTYFDLAGLNVPILVSEQGVGRDEQPITDYLNKAVGEGVGGHWYTTYAPKPLFTTNYNRSLALEITETSFFDLTRVRSQNYFTIDVWSDHFSGKLMNSDSIIESVSKISEFTGKQSVLPRWTQEGAIVGLEGGTENVTRIVDDLLAGGVPVVGVWLQDWVGLRHSWDGDRLIWNWELNNDYYPNWEKMTSNWKKQGIRVLTYLNPFFSDPSGFVNETELRHNFYQEGLEKGYFVKQANGSTYLMYSLSIEFATLDMTNPEARAWMKSIIINQTLIEAHSSGWMCDFGEYLPFDAVMANGQTGSSYHNYYPQAWAELTAEAVKEYNEQQGITENEIMYFMRSAWTWSPAYVPAFWLGDQLMSWDGNDGIKTVITGALSSGLTGHTITHSDIGGYTAEIDFENSQLNYIRSPELLKRWSELGAFGFGLFRTHIGSSTNSVVAQIYDSPESIAHFAQFATIHAQLADYRTTLMKEAAEKGLPMIRPLIFYYGYDEDAWNVVEEYLVGEELLVAPCMTEGATETKVYFPAASGKWYYLWDKSVIVDMTEVEGGLRQVFSSPIGYPPVFYKEGSTAGEKLQEFIYSKNWQLSAIKKQ